MGQTGAMNIYTFYCCAADGSAPSFEAREFATVAAAAAHATHMLSEYLSASHIVVCLGDVEILTEWRQAPPVVQPARNACLRD